MFLNVECLALNDIWTAHKVCVFEKTRVGFLVGSPAFFVVLDCKVLLIRKK